MPKARDSESMVSPSRRRLDDWAISSWQSRHWNCIVRGSTGPGCLRLSSVGSRLTAAANESPGFESRPSAPTTSPRPVVPCSTRPSSCWRGAVRLGYRHARCGQADEVLSADEHLGLGRTFLRDGIVVCPVADLEALCDLRRRVATLVAGHLGCRPPRDDQVDEWLDTLHGMVSPATVNALRVAVMAHLGDDPSCRRRLVEVARPWLNTLVGNELAIQRRPNLSVQLPGDTESTLPIHADTWSGHSPFEMVVWLPLVDCWGTKSMYVVPQSVAAELWERFAQRGGQTTDDLFEAVADDVTWIEARFGEVVLFDQSLPHGNRTNRESTTRWSINCRVTGLFTPYADKGLGDFFTPVSLRPVTARALGLDDTEWP